MLFVYLFTYMYVYVYVDICMYVVLMRVTLQGTSVRANYCSPDLTR